MKVLMLGWELPPHNSGGLGVACYQLCKALSEKDVDIEFILPYEAQHDAPFMKITAAIPQGVEALQDGHGIYDSSPFRYTTGNRETISTYDQYERYAQGVDSITEVGEYDIIHAHDWLTFRAAIRAKQQTGKPLIAHIHATEYDRAGGKHGNPLVEDIEYLGMMFADRIVAVSKATKDIVIQHYGIDPDKIDVIHNSIDPSYYESIDTTNEYTYLQEMKGQGYQIVTYIGRITVQKGLYNLLLAAKEVIARAPKTIFLIVGGGDQLFELIEHAAGLGISRNVLFVDFQRGKRWRDAFTISDLFVLPSVSEPFGLTPLEAIYFGTPVLITKQSGISEVLHNCLKVDAWDVNEMANQIVSVVQNGSLRDSLHQGSLIDFNNSTWDTSVNKLLNIYGEHVGMPA